MLGSQQAIDYAMRDFQTVERAMPLVRDRRVAVQAGACLGVFPQLLALRFQAVYAFEPDPKLFRMAISNVESHDVIWFNAALGSHHEMVSTACVRRDGSSRPVHEGLTHIHKNGHNVIPTMKIDELELPFCDLLCLDIEGRELHALQGARETIRDHRPVIVVEINKQLQHEGLRPDDVRTHITMMGYAHKFSMHSDEVYVPC